jgi:hypothetical protein
VRRGAVVRRDQADRLCGTRRSRHSEEMIVHDLTLSTINQQLVRGPFVLVRGVRRAEGQALLAQMNKAAGAPADLKT